MTLENSARKKLSGYCGTLLTNFTEGRILQIDDDFEMSMRITISERCWDMLSLRLELLLTPSTYLSPYILRSLFYGCVHEKDDIVVSHLQGLIQKHWEFHPPCREGMYEFYSSFLFNELTDHMYYAWASTYTFWNVIKLLKDLLLEEKYREENVDNINARINDTIMNETPESSLMNKDGNMSNDSMENKLVMYHNLLDDCLTKVDKLMTEMDGLSSDCKRLTDFCNDEANEEIDVNKLFHLFKMYLELLELDLVSWLQIEEMEEFHFNSGTKKPLLAKLLWEDKTCESTSNFFVQISELFISCGKNRRCSIATFIGLVAEVTRMNDRYSWYSFDLNSSENFVSAVTQNIISVNKASYTELAKQLSPPWFQIQVISYMIKGDSSISSLQAVTRYIQSNLYKDSYCTTLADDVCTEEVDIHKSKKQRKRDPNKKDPYGQTRVHIFCRQNKYIELENYLRLSETNINIQDNFGWTPLHEAVKNENIKCLEMLLKYRLPPILGADILNLHIVSRNGISPLMVAVGTGNLAIVELLLMNGAGFTMHEKSPNGMSAFAIAKEENMKALLYSYQVDSNWPSFLFLNDSTIELLCLIVMTLLGGHKPLKQITKKVEEGCSKFCDDKEFEEHIGEMSALISKLIKQPSNPKYLRFILNCLQIYESHIT